MIHHYWSLITKETHIDRETNNLIVGETLENIQFGIPPALSDKFHSDIAEHKMVPIPAQFEFVSYLASDEPESKVPFTLNVKLPNDRELEVGNVNAVFGSNGRTRIRFISNAMPVSGSGINLFRLFQGTGTRKKLVSEIPMFITVVHEKPGQIPARTT